MTTSRTSSTRASTDPTRDPGARAARAVITTRALPNTRAVVGGLLVAVAAVGLFVAQLQDRRPRPPHYLVARHDLVPGQRLQPADLAAAPADLPPSLARRAYGPSASLRGAVVLAPVHAGELLQRGQVADAGRHPGRNQLSFSVDAARALGGKLLPGDRVAVVLTSDPGTAPAVVATDLEVLAVERAGAAVEGAGRVTITVAASPPQVLGVARATSPDRVTVVRTTGTTGSDRIEPRPEEP